MIENDQVFSKKVGRVDKLRISIEGQVQGVGFRPFVYRLAKDLSLTGWVRNTNGGVQIEIGGERDKLSRFTHRLKTETPSHSRIDKLDIVRSQLERYGGFSIRTSSDESESTGLAITPDIATCDACLNEIFDPSNRRYRYPFTNCTDCGPRFSIVESLPYDRKNTTMKAFRMCDECREEYEDPANRRFHAQPNACPTCGPHLELWDTNGKELAECNDALIEACRRVKAGNVLALKGLGGFQLIVSADDEESIRRLRAAKARPEKPFALMCIDLNLIERFCELSDRERRLLDSPQSPVVLLKRKTDAELVNRYISPSISPGVPYLGIMLPYTPLHHLMMTELNCPVVATSGNLADEPICIDESEAVERLNGIADFYLVHNRPIARHVDDSVAQIVAGDKMLLRCARGFAPVTIRIGTGGGDRIAVGADSKNTIALSKSDSAVVSQHIGDLSTKLAYETFTKTIDSLEDLYGLTSAEKICDSHPDYRSARVACKPEEAVIRVQHHVAHIMSCVAERQLELPVLGVAWDGTGFGTDGTIWGGEFLRITAEGFNRVAHLRQFRLPGNEKAVREPRRSAMGVLHEIFGERVLEVEDVKTVQAFRDSEMKIVARMLEKGMNSPLTSSAGRFFDAVASIIGLRQYAGYEGQAAMNLQFAAETCRAAGCYEFQLRDSQKPIVVDWEATVRGMIDDIRASVPTGVMASKFHTTLAKMIAAVAESVGEHHVVLSGGCFQNKYLAEKSIGSLRHAGHEVHISRMIPVNDGGIALGQLAALSHGCSREV